MDDKVGHRKRLRDKILASGANSLADYELLEAMLFAANPRQDVKPIAKALIKKFGSINKVVGADDSALKGIEGVGESVIATLRVLKTTCERMVKDELKQKPVIDSWLALVDYCKLAMKDRKTEEFRVLYMNSRNMLIDDVVMQEGTVNHTHAYPREVVKKALDFGAASLILVHNHPSGEASPSKADIELTRQMQTAAEALSVKLQDHLIIGGNDHFSFRAHGLI